MWKKCFYVCFWRLIFNENIKTVLNKSNISLFYEAEAEYDLLEKKVKIKYYFDIDIFYSSEYVLLRKGEFLR